MRLVTVAGPPSSGKTSIIIKTIEELRQKGFAIGVVKFDCLSAQDEELYAAHNIPVRTGLSGGLCPDHFFVSNIEEALRWAEERKFDFLITESAGLCNRCSPHIKDVLAICVIDNLSGVNTPKKIGPMLKLADIVVITKGDIVSQAEREVFAYRVRQVNPGGTIVQLNGVTGQGAFYLAKLVEKTTSVETLQGAVLRFTMPGALCSYCLGERMIGDDRQIGVSKLVNFRGDE
ncbi:GTP-binding protein [Methanolobus profundi]|uniref:Ni2+-binding GTPase involved in regulation of expression and maturation of urease and hydrogenase n=1 Tax=Methanolobus profundi TaxID=487685 RepID=A0A1I4PL12_9EURY|nr:GTP-binding protein [Methanolobus profundi]SFM28521.1 Ni2+-binding GTPase involved in regulation of expression and maturation of urease and hydrogenase [Methanolobus profundi]